MLYLSIHCFTPIPDVDIFREYPFQRAHKLQKDNSVSPPSHLQKGAKGNLPFSSCTKSFCTRNSIML